MALLAAYYGLTNRRRLEIGAAAAAAALAVVLFLIFPRPAGQKIDSFARCVDDGNPVTDTNPPICRVGNHVFVGPAATPSPKPENETTLEYLILVEGDSRGSYPKRQQVISTDTQWQNFWVAVHAGLAATPPILPVDFSKYDVVALTEGQKPTGGYNLRIHYILTSPAGTAVKVAETVPGEKCAVTQSFTNRYFLVRTPKLAGPVKFEVSTEKRSCP